MPFWKLSPVHRTPEVRGNSWEIRKTWEKLSASMAPGQTSLSLAPRGSLPVLSPSLSPHPLTEPKFLTEPPFPSLIFYLLNQAFLGNIQFPDEALETAALGPVWCPPSLWP